LDIPWLQSGLPQAILSGELGLEPFGVLIAIEAFFVGCGDDFAIDDQRGGGVMPDRSSQAENDHGANAPWVA
jgi:hypothetical protein